MAIPSIDPSEPVRPEQLRTKVQRVADPLAALIAGITLAIVATDLHELVGLDGDAMAKLEAAALMIAASIRTMLERRQADKVAAVANARESRAHRQGLHEPQPRRLRLAGSDEGGELSGVVRSKISGPDDETGPLEAAPVEDGERVNRQG